MLTDAPVPYRPVSRWTDRFPWITAGMTHRGTGDRPFDLRLFGNAAPPAAGRRWRALLTATGFPGAAHARQVHGTRIAVCLALHEGLHASGEAADGHTTSAGGVLLGVTVADCVPVYLVDPEHRAVALLHAGWRGTAAGIVEAGVATLAARFGTRPTDLHLHLGPAICGDCYEVGPEVFRALGLSEPSGPEPVDVRAVLTGQAHALGVPHGRVSVSGACTLCGDGGYFSHRRGDRERQVAFLGIRP